MVVSTHSLEVVRYATQLLKSEDWFAVRLLSLKNCRLKARRLKADDIEGLEAAGST